MTRGIVAALLAMALACAAARNRTASTRVRPKRSASTLVRQDAPADRSLPHDGKPVAAGQRPTVGANREAEAMNHFRLARRRYGHPRRPTYQMENIHS